MVHFKPSSQYPNVIIKANYDGQENLDIKVLVW